MNLSVVIPIGGDLYTDPWRERSWQWIAARYRELLPEAEVCLGTSTAEPFNRSEARNNAYTEATGDVLVIADADTVFSRNQIMAAVSLIERDEAPWVIPYGLGRYYNLTEAATSYALSEPPGSWIPEPMDPADWEHKLDSTAGLLVLPRTAWDEAGGYDEAFIGWGYEDDAFRSALNNRVGSFERTDHFVMHLWHPVTEDIRFGQPHIAENRARALRYQRGNLP